MLLPFAIESYESRSLPWSSQRLINFFAEAAPGKNTKSPIILFNAPGIADFATGFAGAIRGAFNMNGIPYVVAGDKFYSVASDGTPTLIGSINTFIGNVSMAANRASPQQLCFVDGTDGWIYDTVGGLQQIVDADFQSADTVTFQDGYFIFNWSGTSGFFISNLENGLSYTGTDFADAEGNPDNTVAVYSNHRELWVFGEESIEIYYNSGNSDFPFERISGAYLERGLAAAFSISEEDNTLFWLGNDNIVYRAQGYTPQRISTHAMEEKIGKYSSVSDAHAFFTTISGHKFYHLVFPTGRACFVYDVSTGLWHERESEGAVHFRGIGCIEAYGKKLIGDYFVGRMGEFDIDTYTEFGNIMSGEMVTPPITDAQNNNSIKHKLVEIDIEAGVGTSAGSDPQMWLSWSDDGGVTFSARKPYRSMGKLGKRRTRLRWNRLGSSEERVYKLQVSDSVKRSILKANAQLEVGRS